MAVGQGRVELPTSRLSGVRSNHLSYWPKSSGQGPATSSNRLDLRWNERDPDKGDADEAALPARPRGPPVRCRARSVPQN